MSYYPKKGMYRDTDSRGNPTGVDRFLEVPTAPEVGGGKRWFGGTVTRTWVDGRGEVQARDVQRAEVFARQEEAAGALLRRCPHPMKRPEGELRTSVRFHAL